MPLWCPVIGFGVIMLLLLLIVVIMVLSAQSVLGGLRQLSWSPSYTTTEVVPSTPSYALAPVDVQVVQGVLRGRVRPGRVPVAEFKGVPFAALPRAREIAGPRGSLEPLGLFWRLTSSILSAFLPSS
jgi:hypothetical protein